MPSGAISGPKKQKSPLSKKPFFQFQANGEGALNCIRVMWPNLSERRKVQALRALTRWMFRTTGFRAPRRTAWEERKHGIREYVPPTMRTAHEAVAWTFGLAAEDYHPAIES